MIDGKVRVVSRSVSIGEGKISSRGREVVGLKNGYLLILVSIDPVGVVTGCSSGYSVGILKNDGIVDRQLPVSPGIV